MCTDIAVENRKSRWERGSGEFVSFAIVVVVLCWLCMQIIAFMEYQYALNNLTKAVTVTGRCTAIQETEKKAETFAEKVAKEAATNTHLSKVRTKLKTVEYVKENEGKWGPGNLVKVTVSAHVRTLSPLFHGQTLQRSVLVTIEGDLLIKGLTNRAARVLMNMIKGVESGGQVYGQGDYSNYTNPYANTGNEHYITLGAYQNYGEEACELLRRTLAAGMTASPELTNVVNRGDLSALSSGAYQSEIVSLISSPTGRQEQDAYFGDLMKNYVNHCMTNFTRDTRAILIYCEVAHLGGENAAVRVFREARGDYSREGLSRVLLSGAPGTKVESALFRSRHQCCLQWAWQYVR